MSSLIGLSVVLVGWGLISYLLWRTEGSVALGRNPEPECEYNPRKEVPMSSQSPKRGVLSGYKTYIVSALTVLAAVAAYFVGEPVPGSDEVLALPELAQLVVTAILAATIRNGVKNDSKK